MSKKEIRALEDCLSATAGMLPEPGAENRLHFFDEAHPGLVWCCEQARADVTALGMQEVVEHAITQCLGLARAGQSEAACDLLLAACGQLREKSGTFTAMRRMYAAPTRH